MSATEVIEEIKRLSPEERSKVIEFVRHLPNKETLQAMEEPLEGLPRFKTVKELFNELES